MANFKFDTEDMFDSEKFMTSAVSEINKGLPENVGPNLKTSRHHDKREHPMNVTMFNLSEILMKAPGMNSIEDVLSQFESIVTGTVGSLYDEIKGLPGVGAIKSLIPEDLRAVLDGLNPDDTGKEGKDDATGDGTDSSGTGTVSGAGDAKSLLSIARLTLGVTEDPPGSNMTKFHKEMGVGACFWCALWIMWCFRKAGIEQKQISAAVQTTYDTYKNQNRVGDVPKVGALQFFQYSRNNKLNHIGIVVSFDDTHVTTIEGNTSSSNKGDQSNGGGVFEKKHRRDASYLRGYAYPIYPEAPAAPTTNSKTTKTE